MLCNQSHSQLVIIDMQSRLLNTMQQDERAAVVKNARILIEAADILHVPALITEQYPKGLGRTDSVLTDVVCQPEIVEKTCFSSVASSEFRNRIDKLSLPQFVLCGIEAHICVLQTAIELIDQGKEVFVVEDAVCSRSSLNKQNALQRIRQSGGIITNMESVLFEWMKGASHEHFKKISSFVR